jgi:hypothetical protein
VSVGRGILLSCRTEDGETLKAHACGSLGFDALAQPRLRRLDKCPAAVGAEGRLSIAFALDFQRNSITPSIGRGSSMSNIEGIGACIHSLFEGASLSAIDHDNVKYGVLYHVTIGSKEAQGSTGSGDSAPPTSTVAAGVEAAANDEEGTSQVVWEVAIVRDQPRIGSVVARLPRGSKVKVGTGQEGWYRVKFGSSFTSEGWLYRGAIGK